MVLSHANNGTKILNYKEGMQMPFSERWKPMSERLVICY